MAEYFQTRGFMQDKAELLTVLRDLTAAVNRVADALEPFAAVLSPAEEPPAPAEEPPAIT